ncbi:MAG: 3-dehydroquinate synthase [Deltaproteobacteria bacterium]|nr:3-dehydroquinate synthase [Deltaproteobacteria bacterium]
MREIRQRFEAVYSFPIYFVRGAFALENPLLAEVFRSGGARQHRALLVIDSAVRQALPDLSERARRFAAAHAADVELVAEPFEIRGGEVCKNDPREVEALQGLIEKHRLCRQSFVVAVGGGAVLDAAGFAAATAHRGIRLIRMPTTVLAQNDAGVGVKNGVNAFGRKNFLGTFAPPFAIVNDFDFLETLGPRDLRAGIAEAVKVALIKDRGFFDALCEDRKRLASFEAEAMERMIVSCAELHIRHIATSGDPFECGSARPLDFGHWSAHKLEELTSGGLKHGEAVAIGIALDSLYARRAGLLTSGEVERVLTLLRELGFALFHPALRSMDIAGALEDFREHLGGGLTITLPDGIGARVEVSRVDTELMGRCVDELASLAPAPA